MVLAYYGLTLEEFLRMPEKKPALEYEDGQVVQKVSPKTKHSRLQAQTMLAFMRLIGPDESLWVLPELRVTFNQRSVVPDIAVFRRDRLPLDAAGEPEDDLFLQPDLVVEIVSPRQSVTRLVRRCLWYAANGVRVSVLVDPGDRSVLIFRPDAPSVALRGADVIDLGDVVPGFAIPVEELFASLRLA